MPGGVGRGAPPPPLPPPLSLPLAVLGGSLASAAATGVSNPFEVLKTRCQLQVRA